MSARFPCFPSQGLRPAIGAMLVALAGAVFPAAAQDTDAVLTVTVLNHPVPDRPAVPVVHVDGKRLPVVNIRSLEPRVMVDGKEVTVSGAISLIPGVAYRPGLVKVFLGQGTTEMQQSSFGHPEMMASHFHAELNSDIDLEKVFVIVPVFEDPSNTKGEIPRMDTFGSAVGNLKAGKSKSIDVTVRPFISDKPLLWTVLVFSGGSEVRTSPDNPMLDYLFDLLDRKQFDQAIQQRAYGTYPLAAFRRFPFRFKKELNDRYAGRTLKVTVSVSTDGVPEIQSLDVTDDPELATELREQLSAWLLLPAVKGGAVQGTRVVIPIQFGK